MNNEAIVTIIATNIINYVGLCERLATTNIMNFMNSHYYGITHRIILQNKGLLDLMIGDKQLSYWKLSNNNNETHLACKSAIDILNEINLDQHKLSNEEHFIVNISIVTGKVLIMNNTIVGDIANLCVRLASAGKLYGTNILIDERTNEIITKDFITRAIDKVIIKGKKGFSELYELVDMKKL